MFEAPLVRFHCLIDQARPPQRADRSAAGTLPTRACRYCEPVTSASAFGWWIFPPLDITLLWDGADIFWRYGNVQDWLPLQPAAQFPDFAATFDRAVPDRVRGYSPPLLTALPEPGLLQVWTGVTARTAAGWSLLLRAPANLPATGGYVLYEGIVESDRWFGPLFTTMRLTRSHMPVRLRSDYPLLQAQPLPRLAYSDCALESITLRQGLGDVQRSDWDDYFATVVVPNQDLGRTFGRYAIACRRRAKAGAGIADPA